MYNTTEQLIIMTGLLKEQIRKEDQKRVENVEQKLKELSATLNLMTITGNPRHFPDYLKVMNAMANEIHHEFNGVLSNENSEIENHILKLKGEIKDYLRYQQLKSILIIH